MARREREQNKAYRARFNAAAEKSVEAGALSLVDTTIALRLTDKRRDNGTRNMGYAFKYALEQLGLEEQSAKPTLSADDKAKLTENQKRAIKMAADTLQASIYSY